MFDSEIPFEIKCGDFYRGGVFSDISGLTEKYGELNLDSTVSLGDVKKFCFVSIKIKSTYDSPETEEEPKVILNFTQNGGSIVGNNIAFSKIIAISGELNDVKIINNSDFTVNYRVIYF